MDEFKGSILNFSPKEFDQFVTKSHIDNESGVYHILELQRVTYKLVSTIIETGVDSKGNPLTERELQLMDMVIKQTLLNLKTLKAEYQPDED